MTDTSKVKIERIDDLITELANLSTSITELNQSFTDFKALTNATLENFQETVNEEFSEMQTSLNNQFSTMQTSINSQISSIQTTIGQMRYVIEYWQEGTEWYRVWSDGWIEQGGFVGSPANAGSAVNFKKSFQTSNYSFIVTGTGNSDERTSVLNRRSAMGWIYDNTRAYVCSTAGTEQSTTAVRWFACGF